MRGFVILLILGIILETIFFPYPFTLLIVIMAVLALGTQSFIFVFLAGIILDIFALRMIGLDSLIFLAVSAFILRYNRRINFSNYFNGIVFILITISGYTFVIYKRIINIQFLVFTILISYLLFIVANFLSPRLTGSKKLRI